MGDLHEELEGRSRGPGRVPRGGVRQIESAQTLPRAGKNGCSDAQGCPECCPPTATSRDCVQGSWHRFPCKRVPFKEMHAYTYIIHANTSYTYVYIHIHTYTYIDLGRLLIHEYSYIYMQIHAYTCIYIVYIRIHAYTYIYIHQLLSVRRCF